MYRMDYMAGVKEWPIKLSYVNLAYQYGKFVN
jgi:hypothetical protein